MILPRKYMDVAFDFQSITRVFFHPCYKNKISVSLEIYTLDFFVSKCTEIVE